VSMYPGPTRPGLRLLRSPISADRSGRRLVRRDLASSPGVNQPGRGGCSAYLVSILHRCLRLGASPVDDVP
jgi:hypothetical protein